MPAVTSAVPSAARPADPAEPASATDTVRVCHVSMCLRTGGLERLLVDMARHGDPTRVDQRFIALAELGPPADELASLGFEPESMGFAGGTLGKLKLIARLRAAFRRHRPHVVHAHNTYAQLYAAIAARLAGVPAVVCTEHGRGCGPNAQSIRQFRLANRFTDVVCGVSEDAAALCREQAPRHAAKIRCLWNGVNVDRFAYHGPADGNRLIAVSRLSPEKDIGTLLRAVAVARPSVPDLQLTIVGDGAERAMLEALSEELSLTDAVTFLGERSDVPDQLAAASLFVSSSLTEGISLTFLEAMGVGLPVLATRVGGNPEVIVPGDPRPHSASPEGNAARQTGELVPSADPGALGRAIVAMCENRSRWAEWGRNGRERVETQFSLTRMLADYADLYESLVR